MNTPFKLLVFTDMDGTLLDHHTYSWQSAISTISQLKLLNIPIICNTSKTYQEVKQLHFSLSLDSPFIVENGSAIFDSAPKNSNNNNSATQAEPMHLIGANRTDILDCLALARQKGFKFSGFNDWSVKQVIQHTGLNQTQAEQSAARAFSEPLIWQDTNVKKHEFIHFVEQYQYTALQGGRFLSVQGQCDKGQALKWYAKYYEQQTGQPVLTVALGDSGNDIAMLEAADVAVWIKSEKPFPQLNKIEQVYYSTKPGPKGWQQTMAHILHLYQSNQLVKTS